MVFFFVGSSNSSQRSADNIQMSSFSERERNNWSLSLSLWRFSFVF